MPILAPILGDVCRSVDADMAQSVSLLENVMYKRRRLAQPALPTSQDDAYLVRHFHVLHFHALQMPRKLVRQFHVLQFHVFQF